MCQDLLCVRSEEAVQHPCILATLSEMWLVLGTQLFIEKIHYGMVTQQPAAVAEGRPILRCRCSVVTLGHIGHGFSAGVGVGWGVYLELCQD